MTCAPCGMHWLRLGVKGRVCTRCCVHAGLLGNLHRMLHRIVQLLLHCIVLHCIVLLLLLHRIVLLHCIMLLLLLLLHHIVLLHHRMLLLLLGQGLVGQGLL